MMPVGFLQDRLQGRRVTIPGTFGLFFALSDRDGSLRVSLGLDRQHGLSRPSLLASVVSVECQVNQDHLSVVVNPPEVFGHGAVEGIEAVAEVPALSVGGLTCVRPLARFRLASHPLGSTFLPIRRSAATINWAYLRRELDPRIAKSPGLPVG